MEGPWTILELAELAADALAPGSDAPGSEAGRPEPGQPEGLRAGAVRANGRVRDVPNERLVRWYVTVGLVDPPLSRRGRVAQYGRRHLLQLVAVKRRQAEGRSLADIQTELAGATDEALADVARVPADLAAPEPRGLAPGRFWTRSASGRAAGAVAGSQEAGRGGSGIVHGIRLAPGVTLLLEGADREPGPDDVIAILNAARSLLAELAGRRLREPGPEHPADVPGPPPEVGSRT
jgi:hypothetical protein